LMIHHEQTPPVLGEKRCRRDQMIFEDHGVHGLCSSNKTTGR
jgi:hypothetical protein